MKSKSYVQIPGEHPVASNECGFLVVVLGRKRRSSLSDGHLLSAQQESHIIALSATGSNYFTTLCVCSLSRGLSINGQLTPPTQTNLSECCAWRRNYSQQPRGIWTQFVRVVTHQLLKGVKIRYLAVMYQWNGQDFSLNGKWAWLSRNWIHCRHREFHWL